MQVRLALEVHARELGVSLADIMHGVGDQARRSLDRLSTSLRFTPSLHASLLRAVGVAAPSAIPETPPESEEANDPNATLSFAHMHVFFIGNAEEAGSIAPKGLSISPAGSPVAAEDAIDRASIDLRTSPHMLPDSGRCGGYPRR